ncbi:MAG: DUF4384 domain-containing protein [Gemmatimonadota bacterium]|nr:DUF4384 domain-containing protein [Gemmatimonadota bacterium]MDH5198096.1 DUF4384 domain-containing protein [Gemmatimonadota bacterium]
MRLANILTVSLLVPVALGVAGPDARAADRSTPGPEHSPQITLWTNRADDLFERGNRMTIFVRTDVDAYVTLFRVNTDGRVRVLYPARPYEDSYVRGATTYAVPGTREGYTLRVEEYPGEGFLFALVTLDPIAFDQFARGPEWNYASLGLASRITGDPYVLFSDLLAALVPETYPDYAYAVTPYYVGARHDYPRFMCYQCHAYVSPAVWNPYAHSCIRVGVPEPLWWRYPFNTYGGTVVVGPPRTLPPGYVIAPRTPTASPASPGGRGIPANVAPGGRRPAPTPVAVVPPARRPTNRPAATPRTPARAGRDTPARAGSPPSTGGRTGTPAKGARSSGTKPPEAKPRTGAPANSDARRRVGGQR